MFGMVLTGQRLPSRAIGIGLVVLTVLAIGGATANGLRYNVPENATATITLTDVPGTHRSADGDRRRADHPAEPGQRQPQLGVDSRVAGRSGEPARPGRRQSREARARSLPHHRSPSRCGVSWKTLLRVHDGNAAGRGADLPRGRPGHRREGGSAPRRRSTRPFVAEITILQRERNPDTPEVLWTIGGLVVLACTLILIGASRGAQAGSTAASPRAARPSSSPRRRRDGDAHVEILAHHGLLLAIPAFAPADRRRRCGDLHRAAGPPSHERRAST